MKTNISLSTSDEERESIALSLGLKHKLATRKDIVNAVTEYISAVLIGGTHEDPGCSDEVRRDTDEAAEATAEEQPTSVRDTSVRGFVPSRGDEPYLYRPQDPELAAACSAVLDGLEHIERHAWATLEGNRE